MLSRYLNISFPFSANCNLAVCCSRFSFRIKISEYNTVLQHPITESSLEPSFSHFADPPVCPMKHACHLHFSGQTILASCDVMQAQPGRMTDRETFDKELCPYTGMPTHHNRKSIVIYSIETNISQPSKILFLFQFQFQPSKMIDGSIFIMYYLVCCFELLATHHPLAACFCPLILDNTKQANSY